jgi:predicted SnoaL-like aldol condensation-catalyzing enzyme
MSVKKNKELVRRGYELLNQGNYIAYYDDLCTPGLVIHLTDRNMDLEQSKQFEANWYKEGTNIHATINDMIAEEDKVVVLVTWRWTEKATGKNIEMTNANIFRIANNKRAEEWNVTDIRLAQQLGSTTQ